ncbi:VOC family protein [Pontibacter chitinilyticus]|uniref:VOC family protein n=1 Tax=Pontibacter chitinilyticus TaxID=2674989 RepID=UPI003219B69D
MIQQKITPFLWFDNQSEEAMKFYTSIFSNSKIGTVTYYADGAPLPKGTVMTASFQLEGQEFVALNGGPVYTFTPAVSFVVTCQTQDEVDHYWDNLVEGGTAMQCGWLQDKFGVTWQIVPAQLPSLLRDKEKAGKVMQAFMKMKKLSIPDLVKAYEAA